MKKSSLANGQRFVDKKGRVWEIVNLPNDETGEIKVRSITMSQDLSVTWSSIKNEWKRINY